MNEATQTGARHRFGVLPLSWIRTRPMTVGASWDNQAIRLVRCQPAGDDLARLLDCRTVPFQPGIAPGTERFAAQLGSALSEFCGSSTGVRVWAAYNGPGLTVQNVRIPKIPQPEISNAVYWTFKREHSFDEQASVFDYDLEGETVEEDALRTGATAFTVPRDELNRITELFDTAGFPLAGVTLPFFAGRNLFVAQGLAESAGSVVFMHVGVESSRIAVFARGSVVLSRNIKSGMNTMIDCLIQESSSEITRPQAHALLSGLTPDHSATLEDPGGGSLIQGEVCDMIFPALMRLIRQMERTLAFSRTEHGIERPNDIYLSGTLAPLRLQVGYMADQLGTNIHVIDPLESVLSDQSPGPSCSSGGNEGEIYELSVGLALSEKYPTPNLLHTCRDREIEKAEGLVTRRIYSVAATLMCILCAVCFMENWRCGQLSSRAAELRRQLDEYGPGTSRQAVSLRASDVLHARERLTDLAGRAASVGVFQQLCEMTPPGISIQSARFDAAGESPDSPSNERKEGELTLDGQVVDRDGAVESFLLSYMIKLRSSPLFGTVKLCSSVTRPEVPHLLNFSLAVSVVPFETGDQGSGVARESPGGKAVSPSATIVAKGF